MLIPSAASIIAALSTVIISSLRRFLNKPLEIMHRVHYIYLVGLDAGAPLETEAPDDPSPQDPPPEAHHETGRAQAALICRADQADRPGRQDPHRRAGRASLYPRRHPRRHPPPVRRGAR